MIMSSKYLEVAAVVRPPYTLILAAGNVIISLDHHANLQNTFSLWRFRFDMSNSKHKSGPYLPNTAQIYIYIDTLHTVYIRIRIISMHIHIGVMYIHTFTLHLHYIYITFTLHLHYIYITFTLHLHFIYITCHYHHHYITITSTITMQALNPLPTEPGARCKGGPPGPGKHGDGLARKPAPKGWGLALHETKMNRKLT